MSWFEIKIKTSEIAIEAVSNILCDVGAGGVMILNPNDPDFHNQSQGKWDYYDPQNIKLDFDGVLVTGYLEKESVEESIEIIKERISHLKEFGLDPGLGELSYEVVDPKDWENEWKKYFKPIRLGNRMVVKPTWETFDANEDDIIIEIDPGNAFGSGTHETTSMCIEMIEKYMKSTDTVIDVGCGSGILSIAAGLLGAQSVVAVDIDENAVRTARENLAHNGLSHISDVRQGDLVSVISEKGDLVVANIIAEIIVMLVDDIDKVLKDSAYFVASGIILSRIKMVTDKLEASGFKVLEVIEKGEWAVVVSQK